MTAYRPDALAAIARAGGRVVAENRDIQTFTVESASAADFADCLRPRSRRS
jgi:hypothetical protein